MKQEGEKIETETIEQKQQQKQKNRKLHSQMVETGNPELSGFFYVIAYSL